MRRLLLAAATLALSACAPADPTLPAAPPERPSTAPLDDALTGW